MRALLSILLLSGAACRHAAEVHAAFYLWYQTPSHDGNWSHWDHSILPHWTPSVAAQYPGSETRWVPPHDIHAAYYPARGLYSSLDPATLRSQMADLKAHSVAAAIVSWWGRPGVSKGDSQGVLTDAAVAATLDACAEVGGIGVALHLEPYEGRSVASIRADLAHLHARFGAHPGLHRWQGKPVFYVYDSYHLPPSDWASLLAPQGALSVRGSELDGMFFGLWLEAPHGRQLKEGGFDGAYTYFAADGFSHGATTGNWPAMAEEARALGLLFVPSVGPGYDDSKIRPWNQAQVRDRGEGGYYTAMWQKALACRPQIVSVTSYNEWGEGTQVEGATPKSIDVEALAPQGMALGRDARARLKLLVQDKYRDYGSLGEQGYMEITKKFALELERQAGAQREL